ncbi:MAG TPA: TetR/AcrR family transcriptional regulator [Bryobacteraceae bacterium]|nr:TetR/AcrR family transcriptional regulator [Bryobacteraceae bacterium]
MRTSTLTKGERTRQQIVEAAASLFNQRGYEGSTLSGLMEATGLEKGGIYRHFSSKEELAAEAFDYMWQTARELRLAGLEGLTGVAWLKAYIGNFVNNRSPVAGGCPILNTAIDADDGNPMLRMKVTKALKSWRCRLRTVIEDGVAKGEIRQGVDARAAATLIVATLEGALMMSRIERTYEPLREVQRHLNAYIDRELAVETVN